MLVLLQALPRRGVITPPFSFRKSLFIGAYLAPVRRLRYWSPTGARWKVGIAPIERCEWRTFSLPDADGKACISMCLVCLVRLKRLTRGYGTAQERNRVCCVDRV